MRIRTLTLQEMAGATIVLGKTNESNVTRVEINVSDWQRLYPEGIIEAYVVSPVGEKYLAGTRIEGSYLVWKVSSSDLQTEGDGFLELLVYTVDSDKKYLEKSATAQIRVQHSPSSAPDNSTPLMEPWVNMAVERVAEQVREANSFSEAAHGHAEDARGYADEAESALRVAMNAPLLEDVTQTQESMEDFGVNTWTMHLSNGEQRMFYVRNGHQGPIGARGPQGIQGPKGDKGDKGDKGENGSDATVTAENIKTALGYTPASQDDAIVCEVSGGVISLPDSSGKPIYELIIYGKTTQDGASSPDAPATFHTVGEDGNVSVSVGSSFDDENAMVFAIATESGLRGIPVADGGNYTDASGQQWIADTIEYKAATGKKIHVKRVDEVDITSIGIASCTQNRATLVWNAMLNKYLMPSGDYPALLCSVYSTAGSQAEITKGDSVIAIREGGWLTGRDTSRSASEIETVLTDPQFKLLYQIAEPIETDISDNEFEAFTKLPLQSPNTTIYNSDGAHMEAKYIADTKMYIDKEIEAALIELAAMLGGA